MINKQEISPIDDFKLLTLARSLMETMQADNGMISRVTAPRFPDEHWDEIYFALIAFKQNNPDAKLDERLVTGEESEVKQYYSGMEGFDRLETALDNFFEWLLEVK